MTPVHTSIWKTITAFGVIGLAILLALPAAAQRAEEEEQDFGSLTSAEQAVVFDQGVAAYDAGDFETAFELWLPLAQTGNMSAQRNVANMLRQGIGTEEDLPRAVYFYRRAADAGLVNAMVNLGAMLRQGQGVDAPDDREAARLFYEASRAGDPRAQYALGVMAALGEGMDTNPEAALELLQIAASQGLRDANIRLAEAGYDLVAPNDPNLPTFSLPPQLEPAPGRSIATFLPPPGTGPLASPSSSPLATVAVDRPSLRLSEDAPSPSPASASEPEPGQRPTGAEPETLTALDRLLGGTR